MIFNKTVGHSFLIYYLSDLPFLFSVVHEPSGLESLGTQLLAARTGVDELTRVPWRLEPLGGSWRFLGGSSLGQGSARASSPGVP